MNSDSSKVESNDNSLGDIVAKYPASTEEIKRIALMLQAKVQNLPKYVLYKYAPKTEIYKQAEKKEKIHGSYRKEEYKKKLLQRLTEHICNPRAVNHDNCWKLYQMSAIKYVTTELKALNTLLAKTTGGTELTNAHDILELLCSNAFEYEVSPEDVRKLYDIWWLTRVDNLDKLLSLCTRVDPLKIYAKQLTLLAEKVNSLTKTVDTLSTNVESDKSKNSIVINDSSDKLAKLDSRVAIVETQSNQSANSISEYSKNNIARFEKLEQLQEKIQSKVTNLETNLGQEQIQRLVNQAIKLHTVENNKLLAVFKSSQELEIEKTQTTLSAKIDELQQQLAAFTFEIEDLQERAVQSSATLSYKSPLSRSVPTAAHPYKITKEFDFVKSWAATLEKTHQVSLTLGELFAYHCVLLTNNIIVADYRLINSWLDCLGWASHTRHVVASPLWSREEDWAEGAHHLFNLQTGKRTPKLLVIHNFDVGITDCYLIPTLLLWCLNRNETDHLTKLFLIPSGEQTPINTQLLEYAATIDLTDPAYKLEFLTPLPSGPAYKTEIPVGVDPKLVIQWSESMTTLTYDLEDCIQKPFGLTLSHNLVLRFQRTLSSANRFFKDSSAVGIGMHHHILPWIKIKDNASYGAISSRVTQILDI